MARAARTVGVAAAVAGGLALGFLAERRFVHERLTVPERSEGAMPLGSRAGELRTVTGPDGMEVAIESYGPRDAPQVVLSHGWICTGRAWHYQVADLADRYRVITYDQPGHGRTSAPASATYDLDLLGDTLRTVIEEAAAPGPLVLAGHSLGGMTVLNAVDRHADLLADRLGGVVLLSTTSRARAERVGLELGITALARLERGIERIVPVLRDPRVVTASQRLYRSSSDLSTLLVRRVGLGPDPDPQVVAFVEQLVLDSDPDIVLGLAAAVLGVDVEAGLSRLSSTPSGSSAAGSPSGSSQVSGSSRVPTSIVVGTHDRLTPVSLSERMAAVSDGQLRVLDDVGHMSPLEAPDAVNEILRGHLARLAGSTDRAGGAASDRAGGAASGRAGGVAAGRRETRRRQRSDDHGAVA